MATEDNIGSAHVQFYLKLGDMNAAVYDNIATEPLASLPSNSNVKSKEQLRPGLNNRRI
jgi:hypothetical protein